MGILYMLVSQDKHEMPLMVCDTVQELSDKTGASENCIRSAISHAKKDGNKSKYVKVEESETE